MFYVAFVASLGGLLFGFMIFATGTPVSNSMTELYTMQRYLQYERLQELNMTHFDCWASRFGETVTALEPVSYTHLDVYKRQASGRHRLCRVRFVE